MKVLWVIPKKEGRTVILEATDQELVDVSGVCRDSSAVTIESGMEIKVHDIFRRLSRLASARKALLKARSVLRNMINDRHLLEELFDMTDGDLETLTVYRGELTEFIKERGELGKLAVELYAYEFPTEEKKKGGD